MYRRIIKVNQITGLWACWNRTYWRDLDLAADSLGGYYDDDEVLNAQREAAKFYGADAGTVEVQYQSPAEAEAERNYSK